MKVIIEIDFPDALLAKEGIQPSEILKQFGELENELKEQTPEGATITLRVE